MPPDRAAQRTVERKSLLTSGILGAIVYFVASEITGRGLRPPGIAISFVLSVAIDVLILILGYWLFAGRLVRSRALSVSLSLVGYALIIVASVLLAVCSA